MRKQEKGITLIALIITIVVLLILVIVSIKAVQDGGIITHAQNAASKMDKAQIEEIANITKSEFIAETYTNKDLKKSIQEFRTRLLDTFEVTEDTNNDNIIEVNDKYAIVIKNTNLDLEVVEITNALKASSLVTLTYTTSDLEEDGQFILKNININITRLMDESEYNEIRFSDVSDKEKENVVVEYINNDTGEEFKTIEEFVVWNVNSALEKENGGDYNYTTIEQCLSDVTVKGLGITTEDQLYYGLFGADNKQDFIEDTYLNIFPGNYYDYINNLTLYVKVNDGDEKVIKNSIYLGTRPVVVNYHITSNSSYEFILRTSAGKEVANEIINVKNILDVGEGNPYILSTEEADGVWSIIPSSGLITKYNGTDKDVIVPAKIGDVLITSINTKAFYNRKDINSITIPSTIKRISQSVFEGCTGLTNITIPASVTEIGMWAFKGCTNLTNIEIQGNLTEIASATFDGCSSLTSITIPKSVETINVRAFADCSSLTSITIPENVETIGDQAFADCSSLTSITIPENVETIRSRAFANCTNLKSVTILGDVTSIARDTFQYSNNLKNIYFKNSTWPTGEPWGATNATVSQLSQ